MMNNGKKQIKSNNLKVIHDQLTYESLLNKKFNEFGQVCSDPQLKTLCTQAAEVHKQNFNTLKSYLDSHQ